MTAFVPDLNNSSLPDINLALQQLAAGRSNAVGTVTLTASSSVTLVSDDNCAAGSAILLSPLTANAAAAVPTTYVSATANKSFTLTHATNAQVDRTFRYAIHG